jgi:hypothetical protein
VSYHCSKCSWSNKSKNDDVSDSFYEKLVCVFHKFPKYHTKILLGYINTKVGRKYIFKVTDRNESLPHLKVQCFHIATPIIILRYLQLGKPIIRLTIQMYMTFNHSGQ